jgi:predicted O-methyltransferase YrrM
MIKKEDLELVDKVIAYVKKKHKKKLPDNTLLGIQPSTLTFDDRLNGYDYLLGRFPEDSHEQQLQAHGNLIRDNEEASAIRALNLHTGYHTARMAAMEQAIHGAAIVRATYDPYTQEVTTETVYPRTARNEIFNSRVEEALSTLSSSHRDSFNRIFDHARNNDASRTEKILSCLAMGIITAVDCMAILTNIAAGDTIGILAEREAIERYNRIILDSARYTGE